MDVAHTLGIPTTATMMFGMGETRDHRLMHFERLRDLQDRNPGFVSFIPWTLRRDDLSKQVFRTWVCTECQVSAERPEPE